MDDNDITELEASGPILEPITTVAGAKDTKELPLSPYLESCIANFTTLHKRYADYRSKGLNQAEAALKAGSTAKDRGALGRVGYSIEQRDGMKEYINYLYQKRAKASVLDEIELVTKLRDIVEAAMDEKKFADAVKAVDLMGQMIGAWAGKQAKDVAKMPKDQTVSSNNTDVFKEEDAGSSGRMKAIADLLKTVKLDE